MNKSTHFSTSDGWLSITWQSSCRLVIVLPMKLPITNFTSIKFVHNRFQTISQNSTGITTWTCVIILLASIMSNVDIFLHCSHLWHKMDPPLQARQQLPEYGMETTNVPHQKKKLKSQPTAGKVMLTLSGILKDQSLGIIRNRVQQ